MSSNDSGILVDENDYIPETIEGTYDNLFYKNKVSFITFLVAVVFIYIAIFAIIGNKNSDGSRNFLALILEIVLWIIFIAIIYSNVKDLDISTWRLSDIFSGGPIFPPGPPPPHPPPPGPVPPPPGPEEQGEVFHIFNNEYTYEEAKDVCNAYGSRLANYKEVENAYNEGANWCSYGWSNEQMGLFPTQKEIYDKLQQIPGHEHDCGRPGVNGGYFENPNIRLGVNCYGPKPPPKPVDEQYMRQTTFTPYVDDKKLDEMIEQQQSEYVVAPFDSSKWSFFS